MQKNLAYTLYFQGDVCTPGREWGQILDEIEDSLTKGSRYPVPHCHNDVPCETTMAL